MAGAGQPFYMPLLFPFGNILAVISNSRKKEVQVPRPQAVASLDLWGHLTSMFAATRSFLIAYFCIFVLYDGYDYPAFGGGASLEWSWMQPIVVRDLVGTAVIAGGWDWFLYFSPFKGVHGQTLEQAHK